jgi:lipid-binding SYLF domain-containing protein
MLERDQDLQPLLDRAAGYAVFPNVGKGGLIVGGAFGRGMVHDRAGTLAGYAKVTQASIGGVVGGRAFAMLLVFEREPDLQRFKTGDEIRFGAEATAIALTEGCSATTRFDNGVAVFAMPRGGLMADASLSGQAFRFVPAGEGDAYQTPDGSAAAAVSPTE